MTTGVKKRHGFVHRKHENFILDTKPPNLGDVLHHCNMGFDSYDLANKLVTWIFQTTQLGKLLS